MISLSSLQLENLIIAKSWKDDSFRQRLILDPKTAIKELGVFNEPLSFLYEDIECFLAKYPSPVKRKKLTEKELLNSQEPPASFLCTGRHCFL